MKKENPTPGEAAGLSVLLFGETFAGREGDLAELEDVNTRAWQEVPGAPSTLWSGYLRLSLVQQDESAGASWRCAIPHSYKGSERHQ